MSGWNEKMMNERQERGRPEQREAVTDTGGLSENVNVNV